MLTYLAGLVQIPRIGGGYELADGTSFATPKVAGLVAYFRSTPSRWQGKLSTPLRVKNLIKAFSRRLVIPGDRGPALYDDAGATEEHVSFICNGQVFGESCLTREDITLHGQPV